MDSARGAAVCTPSPTVDDAPDNDDESTPPRPFPVVAVALGTCGLGMVESRQAEAMLAFVREPTPPRAGDFKMAVQQALWAVAQDHKRALIALELGRLLMAALLFLAAARVLVRVKDSGWLWRQALIGNVAITFAAAWYERSLVPGWVAAFGRAVELASNPIPSPQKEVSIQEFFRLTVSMSVGLTGLLGVLFLAALAFAMRPQTREHTD